MEIAPYGCDGNRSEVHVFDQWCWLGTARDEEELAEIGAGGATPAFDIDIYHILVRHFERKAGRLEVIPV